MKILLFALIFTFQAVAQSRGQGTTGERLGDAEISNKLVTVARDIQNQEILANQSTLRTCRDNFQRDYKPADRNAASNTTAIQNLERCLQGQIGSASDAERLATSLDLTTYNLIPSTTVKDVTNYLTKNLYRQLTGVDLDQDRETRMRAQLFKNKKQLDQEMFFELYKNQMAKNALYEVARFCFVDFRSTTAPAGTNNFLAHWNNLASFAPSNNLQQTLDGLKSQVTDTGTPPFEQQASGSTPATPQDSQSAYGVMVNNIFGQNSQIPADSRALSNFFFFCGKQINELCQRYEASCQNGRTSSQRNGEKACVDSNGAAVPGAKACIAKTRLTAFRRALASSAEIMEEFKKDSGRDFEVLLRPNDVVKRYGAAGDKSFNELTNNASASFLEATENQNTQRAEECLSAGGAGSECDQFIVEDDSENRIITNTEIVYSAKREAELARVRELKNMGGQSLIDYLEKNYPDLKDKKDDPNLETLIANRWDGRREAMIEEIRNRIGARQLSTDEANAQQGTEATVNGVKQTRDEIAKRNAQDAINEKTRLAQVVLFNNIITSSLNLQDRNQNSLGRNVQALNNELDAARDAGINDQNFSNLRRLADGGDTQSSGGNSNNQSVQDIEFLDEFIGIPKD